jgi:Rrf2 family protein
VLATEGGSGSGGDGVGGDEPVTVSRLAGFYELPAPYMNEDLQALARSGIVASISGPRGRLRLGRPPTQITVLDIVDAIEGPEPAFTCREIRQRGALGEDPGNHAGRCAIATTFDGAERAWRDQLASRTVADLLASMRRTAPRIAQETPVTLRAR